MITRVDNVIIGNKVINGTWVSANPGDIVMVDENFNKFNGSEANALYIGVCTGIDENDMPIMR